MTPPVTAFSPCEHCHDEMCSEIRSCISNIYAEADAAHSDYIQKGVCSGCGACSRVEAETQCRPTQYPSGEWMCAGDGLWETEETEDETIS